MKHPLPLLLLATLLPLSAVRGQGSPGDPLAGAFFPPEMVMQAGEQIGLSQEQREQLRARIEKTQGRSDELRQRLERESTALGTLAKQEHVEEAALLAQLDKVLEAERDLKHLHIGLLATIKNLLTPDQQTKLREMAKSGGGKFGDETRKRIEDKVHRVQSGMQKWQESQRDPAPIARAMQEECKPLFDAGKVAEAEAVLDRLLETLKTGDK